MTPFIFINPFYEINRVYENEFCNRAHACAFNEINEKCLKHRKTRMICKNPKKQLISFNFNYLR